MADGQRFYTQDEVEGILRLASESNGNSGVTHDQLLQIAGEVGLTADQVAAAERRFAANQIQEEAAKQDALQRTQFRGVLRARMIRKVASLSTMAVIIVVFAGHQDPKILAALVPLMIIVAVKRVMPLFSKNLFEEKFQASKAGQEIGFDPDLSCRRRFAKDWRA